MRPGDVFAGKYRVERLLGRGGMGLVVAARHLHLGERVAIKLLLPGSPVTPGAFARFVREGQTAARMRSEHVARVHDAGVLETGEPYLVLEYLEGVDLRTLVRKRGPLSIDTAVVYVLQVCEALAEAHSLGIVHRDLKPANLFLTHRADGSSVVKVIDFGISKITSTEPEDGESASLTAHGSAMGTPSYMAPEQMRSARAVDGRADIWSLGAVLHWLLTGSAPFAGETMIEVYDSILKGGVSLRAARAEAPPELDEVVSCCLRVDPSGRYQNVGQLAAALAGIVAPEDRLSAERAIRISEGSEPAVGLLRDEAPDSSDLRMQLATTAPGGLATSVAGSPDETGMSTGAHRPATEPSLEPSWAAEQRTSRTSVSAPEPRDAVPVPGPAPASGASSRQHSSYPNIPRRRHTLIAGAIVLVVLGGAAFWRGTTDPRVGASSPELSAPAGPTPTEPTALAPELRSSPVAASPPVTPSSPVAVSPSVVLSAAPAAPSGEQRPPLTAPSSVASSSPSGSVAPAVGAAGAPPTTSSRPPAASPPFPRSAQVGEPSSARGAPAPPGSSAPAAAPAAQKVQRLSETPD